MTPTTPAGLFKAVVPKTLPPELIAMIHKPGAITHSAPAAVSPPVRDPNVKPAGGTNGTKLSALAARAMHGALRDSQTVVYVLDISGSMGATGKFEAARAALVATLKQQPATVRFQVIVYDSSAYPLLASNGSALPATEANIRAATTALAALEPRGKSNHLVAVRAALGIGPDFIVLLTDADDLTARTLKPVLSSVSKAPPVCVGLVTPEGVQQPRELK
ncbi:VWA domain-containing protein [Gemmata sp. SH-PL17]|uniref:VWA domain-containing protein n=1 Tax=Gemmata sp. SH-PL17 TaxID=1630693 RepID=UPI0012F83465|nr:VWA domain-containing protein [Gemmata sp. SH-PL17]